MAPPYPREAASLPPEVQTFPLIEALLQSRVCSEKKRKEIQVSEQSDRLYQNLCPVITLTGNLFPGILIYIQFFFVADQIYWRNLLEKIVRKL